MLEKIGRKLKIDIRYFAGGGFWLGLSQVIYSVKSLVIAVLLARVLTTEGFGLYTYILSVFMFTNLFGAPGMGSAIMQSVSRGFEGTYAYLTKKVFLWSFVGSLFLFIVSAFSRFYQHNDQVASLFLMLGVFFPFYSISTNAAYYLNGVKNFKLRMLSETFVSLVSLSMIVGTVLLTQDIIVISLVVVGSQAMMNLAVSFWLMSRANNAIDYESYQYGKKMSLNYLIPTAKLQIDKIFVAHFLSYSSTAIYSVANAVGDQIYSLAKIAGSLIAPKSANFTMENIRRDAKKNAVMVTLVFMLIAGVSYLLVPSVIAVFFGSKYPDASLYARVIVLFIPIRCLGIILRNIHESQKNIAILNISSNYIPILEIALMFLGVMRFGILGIIGAKIIADSISLVMQVWYVYKKKS